MDAKSKARFINSVASGQGVPCPSCNYMNPPGAVFCRTCGTRLQPEEPVQPEESVKSEKEVQVVCPACHTVLEPDAVFCFSCGTRIKDLNADEMEAFPEQSIDAAENAGPAFRPVDEDAVKPEPAAVKRPVQKRTINFAAPVEEKEEEVSVFAQGLPSWDVVPPQVVVRRMKKK